jgi:hypothetical protein
MADVSVKVITPATNFDLLTLEELKILINYPVTDTSLDTYFSMLISTYSAYVSEVCNRTFAKETVEETWRELYEGRVFLTHWPVKDTDITSVLDAGYAPSAYELEEVSGKVSNVALYAAQSMPWSQSVVVNYTGGFILPDEAPLPLKQACAILIREERIRNTQAQSAGIRQITHKQSRIVFFDPNAVLLKTLGAKTPGMQAAEALLKQYTRFWI